MASGCGPSDEVIEYEVPRSESTRPFLCEVPPSWKLMPNNRFSRLSFAPKQASAAGITASVLNGSGNEFLLANLNRWRTQVGLDPWKKVEPLPPAKLVNRDAFLAQFDGPKKSIRAAIVEHDGGTWFFKLDGSKAEVAAETENFDAFLRTIEFFEKDGDI